MGKIQTWTSIRGLWESRQPYELVLLALVPKRHAIVGVVRIWSVRSRASDGGVDDGGTCVCGGGGASVGLRGGGSWMERGVMYRGK